MRRQPVRCERRFDRSGFGRVDRRCRAGLRIVQQHAVIVLEAEEEIRLRGHVAPIGFERQSFPGAHWRTPEPIHPSFN